MSQMSRLLYALLVAGLLVLVAGSIAYGQTIETRFRAGMETVGEAMRLPEGDNRENKLKEEALAELRF